ncbi:MAG: hypothetical protein L0L76_10420 [Yaniella sp.]|uniref:hypothetical protein n=1 Tax=Yaniella sp. TaxID=2773929 RepID=UPI002647F340|nr:hypothetical protein [Yaniella sp.]MDN6759003.1 hypothetical protein [Yaniella sp.]
MKGNPHFSDHLLGFPDERSVPAMVAALTYEQRTANLIALYESPLCDTLNGAERLRIENTILEILGIKDA